MTTIDDALEILRETGPEFSSGLSNHGPMATEALLRLGRAEAVIPWVEGYKRRLDQHPVALDRVEPGEWRRALGNIGRVGDWIVFFDRALAEAPWREVLHTWVPRLVPGVMAGATHGLIRTAHAVRSLDEVENELRLHELAEGLGYWAARYQELPGRPSGRDDGLSPSLALGRVPRFHGTERGRIFESVKGLDAQPEFAGAIDLVETTNDVSSFISDVTATFARAFLANPAAPIAFVHAVTAPSGLRLLVPYVSEAEAGLAARYAWQASAAIYAWYAAESPTPVAALLEAEGDTQELIDRAVATGNEHGFKFTEACLREYAIDPKPIYRMAATDWLSRLGKGAGR